MSAALYAITRNSVGHDQRPRVTIQGAIFLKGMSTTITAWCSGETEAGMDYMGWRVDSPATLKKLCGRHREPPVCVPTFQWMPPASTCKPASASASPSPTGHVVELYAEKDYVGNGMQHRR